MGCPCHHTARGVTLMCSLTSRHKGERATPPRAPQGEAARSYFKNPPSSVIPLPKLHCMDADLPLSEPFGFVPGLLKRAVQEIHKGSPPKPNPSRPRGNRAGSPSGFECLSQSSEAQTPR